MEKIEENKEIDKSLRVRVANIMQYEEYLSEEKIKSVLTSYKAIEKWAYIKHDKDKNIVVPKWQVDDLRNCDNAINPEENKELKKPHFHIVLKFKTNISINSIAKWFGISSNYIEAPKGTKAFVQCVQYLTHESATQQQKGKYLYTDEEVKSNFNFREELDLYKSKTLLSGGKSKKMELRQQVLKDGLPLSKINLDDYVIDMQALKLCRAEYLRKYAELPKIKMNYFIRGGSGAGKSFNSRALAKSLIDPHNEMSDDEVFFTTGQGNAMFQGYDGQPVIIYDDVRSWDLINYYNKNAGAIFNLFDIAPSSSEQNIKFGSIKLINSISIVNSIQTFEEFADDICFRARESGVSEPDKQIYRRFVAIFNVKNQQETDFFVNKQYFDPDEPNYKAYKQHKNIGIKLGLINAKQKYGDTNKFIELRNKHFEIPILEHKKAEQKFTLELQTDEEKQAEFDFIMLETDKKIVEVVDFEIETLSEEMQKQKRIDELKAELRKLTAF